ncbi:MAG: TRAP transporter substrate-binding protein [Clostridia bacterium]|nr:TRAP transporter substrate-binding protein [Clostridia bacterium]
MKKLLMVALVLAMVMAPVAQAAEFDLSIAHIVAEDNSWHKASVFFKEQVEARSEGRIGVTIYPNSQLGTEIEQIQSALTGGGVDIVITGESMMTFIPEMGVLGIPYLITSDEHMEIVAGGEIGDEFEQMMLEGGLRCLAYFIRGPRNVTSNIEIRQPSDMQGLIIRTPASTITVATFEAFGAKPTPMAFAEVFTGLQSGTIQAQENPLAMIKTGNFQEVQRYLNRTEHLRTWIYFCISEEKFQSMPEDLQQIILEVGEEMRVYENELYRNDEADIEQFLKDAGMTFIEDVDQAAFAALADGAMQELLAGEYSYMKPLYDQIKAVQP